ncbi:MAG: restriction endonuclease subunit S [Magnetococcales bacterium]|nr:restriction endonuclease subunit S [Magnetococcales bacterium]
MTDTLDITPEQRAMLLALLRRFIPGVAVWAYGSRVKGTARPYSDLDLVVFTLPSQRPLISELKETLDESNLPFLVDVLVWSELPERFRRNIEEKYVVVQEGESETAEGFRGIIERDRVVVQVKEKKEGSVERLPMTWRYLSIDEIKSDEDGAIAIGPFGSRMKADLYTAYGVPVIRGSNISETRAWKGEWVYISNETADSMPNCNVKENDLVFPHRGSIGEVAIIPNDQPRYMLSTSLMKLRCDTKKANPLYVFYYFRYSEGRHQILKFASQVGTPGIGQPLTSLRSLQVPLPPITEQRAIAQVLGALDDKIELNRRMNADLEAMARALFKDWFVDFGPVRAKAEGRPAYLVPEIWDLFPDALDDEDKPVGWISSPLAGVADLNPREKLIKGDPAPYLEMSALPTGGGWPEPPVLRPFEAGSKFRNGDTLLARITPCLENGKTAFVHCLEDGQVGWGSTEFIVIRPIKPFPEEFGYLLARDPRFRDFAIQSMTGTSGRQRVQVDSLACYEITAPRTDLLSIFGSFVKPCFKQIKANAEESQTLAHLRDLLLPKLITGEIRVRDAEKAVEAAL